jgi:hypothetical protein
MAPHGDFGVQGGISPCAMLPARSIGFQGTGERRRADEKTESRFAAGRETAVFKV